MTKDGLILLDDDDSLRAELGSVFESEFDVIACSTSVEAISAMTDRRPRMAVLDFHLGDRSLMNGLQVFEHLKSINPDVVAVMMTAMAGPDIGAAFLRLGGADFVRKPTTIEELRTRLRAAGERAALVKSVANQAAFYQRQAEELSQLSSVRATRRAFGPLVGTSDQRDAILSFVEHVRDIRVPVLLAGETGTGKGVVARLIHETGNRRRQSFVVQNCANFGAAETPEDALFGHEQGAFTDAKTKRPGKVREAQGGTLLLDEVGELELGFQAKLLRLVEERVISPIGSDRDITVDCRFVFATNRNLTELVKTKQFRQDLYERIKILTFTLPPLRDRLEDIDELVTWFLADRRFLDEVGASRITIEDGAGEILSHYSWPGNIRELRGMLLEAAVFSIDGVIRAQHLAELIHKASVAVGRDQSEDKTINIYKTLVSGEATIADIVGFRKTYGDPVFYDVVKKAETDYGDLVEAGKALGAFAENESVDGKRAYENFRNHFYRVRKETLTKRRAPHE